MIVCIPDCEINIRALLRALINLSCLQLEHWNWASHSPNLRVRVRFSFSQAWGETWILKLNFIHNPSLFSLVAQASGRTVCLFIVRFESTLERNRPTWKKYHCLPNNKSDHLLAIKLNFHNFNVYQSPLNTELYTQILKVTAKKKRPPVF